MVHSGQASGGHYYSYILHRSVCRVFCPYCFKCTVNFVFNHFTVFNMFRHSNGSSKWYKFDDGDVSECKMDDDEEMKSQCFGGDYMGEVCCHYSLI